MKKIMVAGLSAYVLTNGLFAGGDIAPNGSVLEQGLAYEAKEREKSDFYVVFKGLTVLGDKVLHEGNALEGDNGYGFGIDFGYRLGSGFAIEYDFAYAQNTITEVATQEEGDARYYSHSLDLIYTYELTESFGIFAKGGYEYETETVDIFNIDEDDSGFIVGAGIEWSIDETYALIAEYETSSIEGLRGDALFAGLMVNF